MNIEEFYRRYDEALRHSKLAEIEVMRRAGVSPDLIRSARKRNASPKLIPVAKVAHVLGVNPFVFLEPLGMTRELLESPLSSEIVSEIINNSDEIAWIGLWRDMDDAQRKLALRMIRNVLLETAGTG